MRRAIAAMSLICATAVALPSLSAQQSGGGPSTKPAATGPALAMTGLWDYNDALSIDAVTGRQEQAPLSATQRPRRSNSVPTTGPSVTGSSGAAGTSSAGQGSSGSGTADAGSAGAGSGSGGSNSEFERAVMAMFLAERRALLRDLLEVPETLRIKATAEAVTFTDDLERVRTYPANAKLMKYQIGAAQFEARATWEGAQFQKDIQGPNKFRMRELYFLSEDGKRLFVVIRVGDLTKPQSVVGVNRVYDRIG